MHTLQTIAPDLLAILTWTISVIGIGCSIIGLNGILRRGWSVERVSAWMTPAILSQAMDRFGWAPLLISIAVLAGCWAWNRRADLIEARQAA